MDPYNIMAAMTTIPCTQSEHGRLQEILEEHDENPDNLYNYVELSFTKVEKEVWGELLIHSSDFRGYENIPAAFLSLLGFLISRQKMEYMEFGVAHVSDKNPGDIGGYYFRILPDGSKQEPELVYPQPKRLKRITDIVVKEEYDPTYDPSYLLTKIENGRIVESMRYANRAIELCGLEKVLAWVAEDQELYDSYQRGERWAVGLWAEATIETGDPDEGWTRNTIRTPGLWGIEHGATEDYKQSVADEEMNSLSEILKDLGFPDCEIKEAIDKTKEAVV